MEQGTKVSYKLINVELDHEDFKDRTGTLLAASEQGEVREFIVRISPWLEHQIRESRKDPSRMQYENVWFTSELYSTLYKENPLKLVRFKDKDGVTINWYLKLVNEGKKKVRRGIDVFQRRVEATVTNAQGQSLHEQVPSKYFRRYEEFVIKS
jgi:hypothetical protein